MTPPRGNIAIIGMACTFPGARDLGEYWENILRGHDAVSDPPLDWEAERYFDPVNDRNDRTYCKRGGYLGSLAQFDPILYGVMPQSVDGSEPDHFLALRAATEALTDAGYLNNPKYRERTEIIIGRGTYVNRGNTTAVQHCLGVDSVIGVLRQLHPDYSEAELELIRVKLHESLPPFHADTAPGLVPNIISGRIANRLDIMGSNYIVDAACASSLVAVELAARDLLAGHCDMAIAGGVHASTPPVILVIFSQLKALSRAGKIRPFGSDADGTLLGEGVGMIVMKRQEDAERDGDNIYAIIKGVGTASDGKALGLLAPRLEGEVLALRRAYESAGVEPSTIGLIEAHGTATLAGDATEVEALKSVFGGRRGNTARCALGSVKSMISHTMPASGMAGLIKAALALRHKVLPPTLHCENPNPKLGLESSNFYLNSETRPWIHGGASPRRAGVNAFGFGGINAHAVLEEYTGPAPAPWLQQNWPSELFVFSGDTREELAAKLVSFRLLAQDAPESVPLNQLAYTAVSQPLKRCRLALVAESRAALLERLERASEKIVNPKTQRIREKDGVYFFADPAAAAGKIAFIFPGEGSQYPGMLADMALHFPEVREWFDLMDSAFQDHARGYLPSDAAFPLPAGAPSQLWNMDVGAETVFCSNMGLFSLLHGLGIRPSAMVGHSTGEHSALLASGVISLPEREQRIGYVLGVNRVFESLNVDGKIESGVLLAVAGAGRKFLDDMVAASNGALYVALDNCPHQVVICGTEEALASATARLTARSAICQRLPMNRAYHTPQFTAFSAALRKYLDTIEFSSPAVDLYSCVTADRVPTGPDAVDAMRTLACRSWAETVRFQETVKAMHRDGVRVFIECGPRGNLTSFVSDSLSGKDHLAMPANVQHRSGITQLHHLLALLVARGVDVDFSRLHKRRTPVVYEPAVHSPKRPILSIASGLQALRLPAGFLPSRPTAASPSPAEVTPAAVPPPTGVNAYFDTMRQFLTSSQEVFKAFSAVAAGAPQTTSAPAVTRPFLSETAELVPGVRARAICHLSLDRFPLFTHHTLGRSVSESNPSLTGLPVVPLTVTMEILGEAASLLAPGQVLAGISDFSSSRWITLETSRGFELTAVRLETTGHIRVQLRPVGAEALRPIWAEGVFEFAANYAQPATPVPVHAASFHESAWRTDRLYVDGMFHGPSFQAVRRVDKSSREGNVSTLDVLRRDELISGTPSPNFLLDPVVLDAAGQCVAFWTQEEFEPYGDIFPFYFGRLHCFGPPAILGTRLECRVLSRHIDASEVHTDIQIFNDGRLVYLIENWKDKRFRLPRMLWDLRTKSVPVSVAEPWPGVSGVFQSALPLELLEMSHGIWAKMLAHIVLGAEERPQWLALSSALPQRRAEWLRGRCAAKEAVRHLARRERGIELFPADIQLIPNDRGKPELHITHPAVRGMVFGISISHTDQMSGAACVVGGRTGLAIENLETPATETISPFSAPELAKINNTRDPKEWRLRARCAKEALLKHLGIEFHNGFQAVEIIQIHELSGDVEMRIGSGIEVAGSLDAGRKLTARTLVEGPVAFALTLGETRDEVDVLDKSCNRLATR